jgi:hypothetical protein
MKLLKNIANFTNLKIPEIWAQLFPMQIVSITVTPELKFFV